MILRPLQNTRAINLGSTTDVAVNTLELSDAELDRITAGTIRIGTNTSDSITISQAISPSNASTLHLITGGGVSQSAGITVPNLAVEANGNIALGMTTNDVNLMAASSTGGFISFGDLDDLSVSNASATGGGISLTAQGPLSLTGNVTATTNTVNLTSIGSASNLSLLTGKSVSGPSVTMQADRMNLAGSVQATVGAVQLNTSSVGWGIDLGSTTDTAANTLELSDAELDRIAISGSTFPLTVYSRDLLTISSPITWSGTTSLNLLAEGALIDGNSTLADVTATNLSLDVASAGAFANALETAVTQLNAVARSGGIFVTDNDDLSVSNASATGGGISLTAQGPLSLTGNVTATTNTVNLTSIGSASNLSLLTGKSVSGPSVTMQADRMNLAGSVQATVGAVQLNTSSVGWGIDLGSTTDNKGEGGIMVLQGFWYWAP